jgi:uncharacterized RDD family membrane protein YckC
MQDEIPGIGRRFTGLLIDFVMLELAMWPMGLAIRELTPSAAVLRFLQFVIAVFYSSVFLAERGQTPGKIMMSLRMLSAGGGAVNQRQAIVRSVVKWGCIFVPIIAMAILTPLPTNVQQIGTEAPLVAPELPPLLPVIGFTAVLIWLVLIVVTRRHRNRQAPHDRVSGTMVMRVQ